MAELVFLVRCPIHVARQWMRHRTWSYNEYSTRYKPAIDSFETTDPYSWRLQSTDNKQGSCGVLGPNKGLILTSYEIDFLEEAQEEYHRRLNSGVAREQARKDLPLSTYTEFYAKTNLHNLLHFLKLRTAPDSQLEIRTYAQAIQAMVKPLFPLTFQAWEDYSLNACTFSANEMRVLRSLIEVCNKDQDLLTSTGCESRKNHPELTNREWKELCSKLTLEEPNG